MAEQHERITTPKPIGVGGVLSLTIIGVGVLVLQIILPWSSIHFARAALRQGNTSRIEGLSDDAFETASPNRFWNRRLRFRQFLHPRVGADVDSHPINSAACSSEEIWLLEQFSTGRTKILANGRTTPEIGCQVVKFPVKGKQFTTEEVPLSTSSLLSDGRAIHLLKEVPGRPTRMKGHPFWHEGRPLAIVKYEQNPDLFQLVEFVDDEWRKTEQFALLPGRFAEVFCFRIGDESHFVVFSSGHDKILYRVGLVTGTEVQATEFDAKYAGQSIPLHESQAAEIGWKQYDLPRNIKLDFGNRSWGLIGFRVEAGHPLLLFSSSHDSVSNSRSLWPPQLVSNGQWWHACATGTDSYVTFATTSNVNSIHYRVRSGNSPEGTNYWACHSYADDDRLFFRIEGNKAMSIGRIPGPMTKLICLDAVGLYFAAVVLPTIVLGLILFPIALYWRPKIHSYAHDTVRLASIARRSFARLIDLVIVILPFLAAVVCHPDFSAWWNTVAGNQFSYGSNPQATWSDYFRNFGTSFAPRVTAFFTPPIYLWSIIAGFAIMLAQVTWQGITGQTIGKWLCGIRVLRVTLRPCGFARSLLRELLMVFDSVGLLSWVPGLLCMVGTSRGQRIGDYLADTVVVRGKY